MSPEACLQLYTQAQEYRYHLLLSTIIVLVLVITSPQGRVSSASLRGSERFTGGCGGCTECNEDAGRSPWDLAVFSMVSFAMQSP